VSSNNSYKPCLTHIDGLVYNYGNSVCENFSGDAKKVLNLKKKIQKGLIKLKLYVQVHRGQDVMTSFDDVILL